MGVNVKIGDVILTINGKLAIVVGINHNCPKYPVMYKVGNVPTTYKGNPDNFKAVLGNIDINVFNAACTAQSPSVGRTGLDDDFLVPAPLKGIKVGDTITVSLRGISTLVIYRGYFPNRPRMPLAFTHNGRQYKAPLSLLVSGAAPAAPAAKRPEAAILADIKAMYCDLSPENLTGDGELPAYRVDQRRRQFTAELKRLFAELGREVSEDEAFDL